MISSYLTLYHTASLLRKRYNDAVIAQIYSQQKNTLSLLLYTPEPHTVTISCNARENYIVDRAGDFKMKKNSIDLFPELTDARIQDVYLGTEDRVVYMQLTGERRLCIEMFASRANVLLCNENGEVLNAFLKKKECAGSMRAIQLTGQTVTVEMVLNDKEEFAQTFLEIEEGDIAQRLKKTAPKLGKELAIESVYRSGLEEGAADLRHAEQLYQSASTLVSRILSAKHISPVIYFDDRSPVSFSLIPLEHLSSYRSETYEDCLAGVRTFISFGRSSESFLQKKKEITSWLTKEIEKAERTIRAVELEQRESSRAEQYELYGNLIMAHLPNIERGSSTANVKNSFTDGPIVNIPMDASLTPQKNAEKYFEKAKKSKIASEESKERLFSLKNRLLALEGLLTKSIAIKESISLKNFLQSNKKLIHDLGFMTEKEAEELPPFKIFTVTGGFTVYAGKNSSNNDQLTFKFARPNDLWFHARGSSGSHVVLKVGSAGGNPSKQAIEQAASIAAYYSKMKNAKHVPVAMTERKYIHKPKGAPAGTVALDKEKVIFVSPVLPDTKA